MTLLCIHAFGMRVAGPMVPTFYQPAYNLLLPRMCSWTHKRWAALDSIVPSLKPGLLPPIDGSNIDRALPCSLPEATLLLLGLPPMPRTTVFRKWAPRR